MQTTLTPLTDQIDPPPPLVSHHRIPPGHPTEMQTGIQNIPIYRGHYTRWELGCPTTTTAGANDDCSIQTRLEPMPLGEIGKTSRNPTGNNITRAGDKKKKNRGEKEKTKNHTRTPSSPDIRNPRALPPWTLRTMAANIVHRKPSSPPSHCPYGEI